MDAVVGQRLADVLDVRVGQHEGDTDPLQEQQKQSLCAFEELLKQQQ